MAASKVQELCGKIVASDPDFTEVDIDLDEYNVEDLKLIFDALKMNASVRTLWITSGNLGLLSTLLLVSAIRVHPTVVELAFSQVTIEEFPVLATLFEQKDKLSRLRLEYCRISKSVNVGLQWLLRENSIQSLVVICWLDGENVPMVLSGALAQNKSLEELILKPGSDSEDDDSTGRTISDETIHEIPLLLEGNQGIKTLQIDDGMTSDMAKVIVQSVENHVSLRDFGICGIDINDCIAESLRHMVENSPTLKELDLSRCSISATILERLLNVLRSKNSNVIKLDLSVMVFEDHEVYVLKNLLETNKELKVLYLRVSEITDTCAFAIAAGLRMNHTLEQLDMRRSDVGPKGIAAISDSLKDNTSLKKLECGGNKIGDAGITSIAEMLVVNLTVETITLGHLTERGMKVFIEKLPRMQAVKNVTLTYGTYIPETGDELFKAVERNTTLEHLNFTDEDNFSGEQQPHVDKIMTNVNYLLALNRAGRKILKCTNVPQSLWPRILGRSSYNTDAIFFFLRERGDSIVGRRGKKTTVGKRKREGAE